MLSTVSDEHLDRIFKTRQEPRRLKHYKPEDYVIKTGLPLFLGPSSLVAVRDTLTPLYEGRGLVDIPYLQLQDPPDRGMSPFGTFSKIGVWIFIRQSGSFYDNIGKYTNAIVATSGAMYNSFKRNNPAATIMSCAGYVGTLLEPNEDILQKPICTSFQAITHEETRDFTSWADKIGDIRDYLNEEEDRIAVIAVTRADNLFLHPVVLERILFLLYNISKTKRRIFLRFAKSVSIVGGVARGMTCSVQELLDNVVLFRRNMLEEIDLNSIPGAMLFEIIYLQNARVLERIFRIHEAGRNVQEN